MFGRENKLSKAMAYTKTASAVVIAPPGSGKFTASICPTLLTNTEDNIVVLDPAGQACAVAARFRRSIGQRVVIINCFNELSHLLGKHSRVNPLGVLRPGSPDFAQDIRSIATIIVPIMQDDKNKFFTDSARDLVMALMIHHRLTDGKQATLPGVNELLQQTPLELDSLFEAMRSSEVASVRHVGNRYHQQTGKGENNSIFGTAKMAMSFLADDAMVRLFGGNDFSFSDLKDPKKPTTVFIVWPALKSNDYAKAAEILIGSAFNSLMTYPAWPTTLFIVDEMQAALQQKGGAIEKIRDAFTNGRKIGLRVMAVAQDWNQFLGMFPDKEAAYTLLTSAGMVQFFGTGAMDTTTQDLIIEQAGNKTIWQHVQSKPIIFQDDRGNAEFLGWEPAQSHAIGVPLLDRLTLRAMQGSDMQIAFLMGGAFPCILPRSHYFNIPALLKRADLDPYETSKRRAS